MQRIFAFDPGTAALGWAVIEAGNAEINIRACGVRHYALTRQRILDTMKLRLKPRDRMKARQRRQMRLRKLGQVLQGCGLAETGEEPLWKTASGQELANSIAEARKVPLSKRSLVRVIFKVHRHRGSMAFGPDGWTAKEFLSHVLAVQSQWLPALADANTRDAIMAAVFHRRPAGHRDPAVENESRLARLAAEELIAVWHALAAEFGHPDLTAVEAAIRISRKRKDAGADDERAGLLLKSAGFDRTRHRLHKARLFVRQSTPDCDKAVCGLTGTLFDFGAAMSSAIEIDHIKPKSRAGTGGRTNLQLAFAQANRAKGAGLPIDGPAASRNPACLADGDALRRSLRLISDHFSALPKSANLSFVSPSSVAAMRMSVPGLAADKERANLFHHVTDAICAGLALLYPEDDRVFASLGATVETALASVRLSARAERSKRGRLHDDTRYGKPSPMSGFDPQTHVAARRPVESLTPAMMARIADPQLRRIAMAAGTGTAPALAEAFGRTRRVKVVHPACRQIIVTGLAGAFKAAVLPADNHHMDIVKMRNGEWKAFAVTRHDRVQPGWRPVWEANHSGGKLVMRLHKGDLMEWQADDGSREVLIVARLNGISGIIHFSRPWATGAANKLVAAAPGTLKKRQAKALEAGPGGLMRFRRSNAA